MKRIGLFGSYAKGVPDKQSDIDLVAEFDVPIGLKFVEFSEYLEHLLGTPVDVLTSAGIQGIRNPRIARDIQETILQDILEAANRIMVYLDSFNFRIFTGHLTEGIAFVIM